MTHALNEKAGKLKHFIRHIEEISVGCWEVSTLTEDGHRLSGWGATTAQAVEDAHQRAQVYDDYAYPSYGTYGSHGRSGGDAP